MSSASLSRWLAIYTSIRPAVTRVSLSIPLHTSRMLVYRYSLSWPQRMHWYEVSRAMACGATGGGIYIPFELYELFKGAAWLSLGALLANIFIVGLMINALLREHPAEPTNAA